MKPLCGQFSTYRPSRAGPRTWATSRDEGLAHRRTRIVGCTGGSQSGPECPEMPECHLAFWHSLNEIFVHLVRQMGARFGLAGYSPARPAGWPSGRAGLIHVVNDLITDTCAV